MEDESIHSDDDCDSDDDLIMDLTGAMGDVQEEKEEHNFEIFSKEELLVDLNKIVDEIALFTSYSPGTCRTMLRFFGWNSEKLVEKFLSSSMYDFFNPADVIDTKNPELPDPSYGTCQICSEETILTGSNCYDLFCADCWRGHINSKLSDGILKVACMDPECNFLPDDNFIFSMICDDTPALEKYNDLVAKDYIQHNKLVRWCAGPDCSNAVKISAVKCVSIKCRCGYSFCFKCSEQSHEPINCDLLEVWLKECADALGEGKSIDWIGVHSKQCPSCKMGIEKNDGCNHMTCKNRGCTYEFCWLCLQNWHGHQQSSCNRYAEEVRQNQLSTHEKAKALQGRYKHYYERYLNHQASIKLEKRLYEIMPAKIESFVQNCAESSHEAAYLMKAIDALIESRRTLMFTYTFAFYLTEGNITSVFELNQRNLEHATEELSESLERQLIKDSDIRDMKRMVIDQVNYVDSRRKALLKHCYEGTEKDEWKFRDTEKSRVMANF